jgi:adrenodoxin-NADP+ reductase
MSTSSKLKHIAVIGAGPSGFYTTQQLIKIPNVKVTLFERRMVPFGLVRYGVAPDHAQVKNATSKFETIASHPQVQFVGNCHIGKDVGVEELQENFNAVVISSGSSYERSLGIPNEDGIGNVFSARSFVGWYNGDPEVNINPQLDCESAAIIGQGNVALDCARILLSPVDELAKTDISERALESLRNNKIKNIYVIGRRGVIQASFTAKEVRELMALPNVGFRYDPVMTDQIAQAKELLQNNRAKKRLMDILLKGSKNVEHSKFWHLKFLSSPIALETNDDNNISRLHLQKNELIGDKLHSLEDKYSLDCGLVIKSIGYMNQGIDRVPFNHSSNTIPNEKGRVLNEVYKRFTLEWIHHQRTLLCRLDENRTDWCFDLYFVRCSRDSPFYNR